MKKFLCIAILVITSLLSKAEDGGIEWMQFKSMDEAIEYSKRVGKPLFVYFTAVWCGPCKKAQQEYFNNPKENEVNREEFVNMKIDIDRDSVLYREAVEEFGFNSNAKISVPTFQLVFSEENYKHKIVGYSNVSDFKKSMELPTIMLKYYKYKDDNIIINALKKDYMMQSFLRLCIGEEDDRNSSLFLTIIDKGLTRENIQRVFQMREFKSFFVKRSYLINKDIEPVIYKIFFDNKHLLNSIEYDNYLSLFSSDKFFFKELLKKYESNIISGNKIYRANIMNWIVHNNIDFKNISEKEVYDIAGSVMDSKTIEGLILDSKVHYYKSNDELLSKYFIEYFDKFNIAPLASDSSGVAYNLNVFAWYHVHENEKANMDLLRKAAQMSLRSVESSFNAVPFKVTEFENYLDTYFKIFKRMLNEYKEKINDIEKDFNEKEKYLFSIFNDVSKASYMNLKDKILNIKK